MGEFGLRYMPRHRVRLQQRERRVAEADARKGEARNGRGLRARCVDQDLKLRGDERTVRGRRRDAVRGVAPHVQLLRSRVPPPLRGRVKLLAHVLEREAVRLCRGKEGVRVAIVTGLEARVQRVVVVAMAVVVVVSQALF